MLQSLYDWGQDNANSGHRLRRADLAQNAHHDPDPNAELARNSTVEAPCGCPNFEV
jgi:hypothetical protein